LSFLSPAFSPLTRTDTMVKIPEQKDPTLEAMNKALVDKYTEVRDYLGASYIGDECPRKVWYSYNNFYRKPTEHIYAIEDGYRTEELLAERLNAVEGVTLVTKDENGEQFSFTDGNFSGHYDGKIVGLLQAPKTKHIWEAKCTNKFNEFLKVKSKFPDKKVLQNWNEIFYVQAQIYMHYSGYTRHYLTVASAGGRDIASCRTEYHRDVALRYIDRAKKIIAAKSEPERAYNSETFFKCRWCDFAKECWK